MQSTAPTSSLDRAPRISRRSFVVGASGFAVALASLEQLGRNRGIVPRPEDSKRRWVGEFTRAVTHQGIALVGSSRAALGLDPAVIAAEVNTPTHNLTINGANPLPILEALVTSGFGGIVVAEAIERRLFSADSKAHSVADEYVRAVEDPSLLVDVEDSLDQAFASDFRTRGSAMSLMSFIRSAIRGELPSRPSRYVRDDRFEVTDVHLVDGVALERRWSSQTLRSIPMGQAATARRLEQLRNLEARLARHGGLLVWVRMPTSGAVLEAEKQLYPRAHTFDRLGGMRWHFADHEETRDLACFDGSHLAPASAQILSRVLGRWLRTGPCHQRFHADNE